MRRCALALVLALCAGPAGAKDLFSLEAVLPSQGQSGRATYGSITDLIDGVSTEGLQGVVSGYTEASAATATLFIRGLPAQVQYLAEQPTLYFRVPSVGIDLAFTGATRAESEDQFENWMKGNGQALLTQMLKELVKTSPVEPVAGTPGSLMGQMAMSDFAIAADSAFVGDGAGSAMGGTNYALVGLEMGRYNTGGYTQDVIKLPLANTWKLGDAGYQLRVEMPLTYIQAEGAKTGAAAIGGALRVPVTPAWVLTPALRIGATGSADLGAGAVMYSASLASRFVFEGLGLQWGITNMVGLYRTQSLKWDDYEVDYDLSNTMLRNGLDIGGTLPEGFLGGGYHWRGWIIDTRFSGDALYTEAYQEFGAAFSTRVSFAGVTIDKASLGLTYTRGDNDLDGFKLNFGYKF